LFINYTKRKSKKKKPEPLTLCISNGGQSAKNETYMNKINGSAIRKVSAENPATTHTRDRYRQYSKFQVEISTTTNIYNSI